MDEIRTLIQSKLSELTTVDCGVPIPDGMVEDGQTYFGYELQEEYRDSDLNKRYTMQVFLTGRLVRKESSSENTLQIMDQALEDIKEKLKELNFKYSYNDISFQDGIRKILVKANVRYYEANNQLLI
ncbi:MAG: hypothetical protein IKO38_07120 [Erysipelotrichaceae bacterium]|nr:hypothetical protein [Erysipelotrichaceae bacterium]